MMKYGGMRKENVGAWCQVSCGVMEGKRFGVLLIALGIG